MARFSDPGGHGGCWVRLRLRPADRAISVPSAEAVSAGDDGESRVAAALRPASADKAGSQTADGDLLTEAAKFVGLFHAENQEAGSAAERIGEIRREIEATGTYRHTEPELTFAAQVAWRNSARCIGRLYWRSLRVRDRRHITAAADI